MRFAMLMMTALIASPAAAAPAKAVKRNAAKRKSAQRTPAKREAKAARGKVLKEKLRVGPQEAGFKLPGLEGYEQANKNFIAKLVQYRAARQAYGTRLHVCKAKAYTVAEQKAAGCKGNDTVSQCQRKLFSRCTVGARTKYALAQTRLRQVSNQLKGQIDRLLKPPPSH